MRVTFLMPAYAWVPSGGYKVVYEYANHLVARGHEVAVVHPRKLSRIPAPPFRLRRLVWSLRERVSTPAINWQSIDPRVRMLFVPNSEAQHLPDADVVFATAWNTVASVLDLPVDKGSKCYFIQSYEIWQGPRELVDATWRAPLHKIVVARWLLDVGRDLGCGALTYIPNALDQHQYQQTRPLEDRRKQVAMLFSVVPVKGSANGIKALEAVRTKHSDLKVISFGVDRRPSWVPNWVTYYRNPGQDFIVENIYGTSSIFVSPSRMEGSPLPPAEAAACGCVPVCTDIGGHREYISDGRTGLLSPVEDQVALAQNICLLLENEPLRLKLACAAQQSIATRTWDGSTTLLETFLHSVTEGDGPNRLTLDVPKMAVC